MKMKNALIAVIGALAFTGAANAQYAIVNNLPGAFIDISGTGTNLGIQGDDLSASFNATHGNSVLAAGNIFASTNGQVTNVAFAAFTNAPMPYGAGIHGYAPLWDDFRTDLLGGDIFWQNNADRTIIQWNNLQAFGTPGADLGTWQIQIFSSGPILAQYIYQDVNFDGTANDNGASATIGVEGANGTFAQWSFNTASIQNGVVLSVVPSPGALALLGLAGLVGGRRRRA